MEAVIGVEERQPNAPEILAGRALENKVHVRATRERRPSRVGSVPRLRLEELVGPLGDAHPSQGSLTILDERRVERKRCLAPDVEVEHREEVFFKDLATARVGCARKQVLGPVVAHPGNHEFAIDRRLGRRA